MIAVFWDRRNNCMVKSNQLMRTKLVRHEVVSDQDFPGEVKLSDLVCTETIIADICYKTEACPSYMNWDKHTTIDKLVFISLEDE